MQNDIFRIYDEFGFFYRVSIEKLHNKCKILSLEQRVRKQMLWFMYLLSKEANLIRVPDTRNAAKIGFKVITYQRYEKSPSCIGTRLWDELPRNVQFANTVYEFKREIDKLHRKYNDLLK